jgi:PIN domain nuclease of toxin-antitoxin system
MRLLLDTHALIWWLVDSPKLSAAARTNIADPRCAVFATPVSGYEIASKERLGRLPGELTRVVAQALRRGRIAIHPLTFEHALAAGQGPGPHRDSWDRRAGLLVGVRRHSSGTPRRTRPVRSRR